MPRRDAKCHRPLQGRGLFSGILFAVALNFKHINLYVAPVFFVHLLRQYCFQVEVQKATESDTVSGKLSTSCGLSPITHECLGCPLQWPAEAGVGDAF